MNRHELLFFLQDTIIEEFIFHFLHDYDIVFFLGFMLLFAWPEWQVLVLCAMIDRRMDGWMR
jgi:hypothetical protein